MTNNRLYVLILGLRRSKDWSVADFLIYDCKYPIEFKGVI